MDDDKKFTGKIYVACESGTESARDAYHHVFFKNGYAYATDAHILARVRLSTITQGFEQDELINALCKRFRGRGKDADVITEIADATIMCQQMALLFGEDEVKAEILSKQERMIDRMKGRLSLREIAYIEGREITEPLADELPFDNPF